MNHKLIGRLVLCAIVVIGMLVTTCSHARADTVPTIDVPATSDIFAADLASAPAFDGGGGTLPPSVAVTPGAVITVSASGSIDCGGGAPSGPDGSTGGGTVSIQSYGGISGADVPGGPVCGLALAGVFTGSTPPADPAPIRLNFMSGAGTSFASLSPVLNQTFFIGDGLTGTGTGATQTFVAPQGATALWLGYQDGQNYTSPPGYYGDDTGSVSVNLTVLPANGGGGNSNTMTAESGSAVVPWVVSVGSNARLQLDLTKDGKDPFCPQGGGNSCKSGPTSTAAYAYFAKTTTFAVKLKNLSTGAKCDSTDTKASQVTPIQPAGSDPIGYQVAFDANCGKKGTPDYTGIITDIFVMDPAFRHNYSAPPGGGSQGTDHLVQTLKVYAGINAVTCLSGKSLTAIKDLLDISDYAELAADINSAKFAEKLAEIKAEDFEDLSTKPIPGTSSCAAERIFAQAAVVIHVEAIAARHNGTVLSLDDRLSINGKHSNYYLYVADPAGIGPYPGSEFPILNMSGSEEDLMLVRAILAGLARTGLIST